MFEHIKPKYDFHKAIYPDQRMSKNLMIQIIEISDLKYKEYIKIYKGFIRFAYERKRIMKAQIKKKSAQYGRGKKIQSAKKESLIDEIDFKGLVGEITHICAICDIFDMENIKFYFPKWLFGTSKSKGIDLIGCFKFGSQENGFIGES
ncbi:MAG: hypothetical protein PVF58_10685 [Candidatus Methanofastidiosia archaeon]|jgi:hypothetical protein